MSVEHYPKNASIDLPIDLVLFNGTTAMTGETANLTLNMVCLDNGNVYDNSDNTFKATPTTPNFTITAHATRTHWYSHLLDVSNVAWRRGHYRARFRHTPTTREFEFDFTLGLVTQRTLGVAAAYDGSTLKGSLWVEEFGEVQEDYGSLANVQILSGAGAVVATVGTLTVQANGIFSFNQAVVLDAVTQYVLKADATIQGYQATPFVFKLRSGLVRP